MKKHFIALLGMMMCFVLSVGIFTACDIKTEVPKKYTISFYDGDELVDTIETSGNERLTLPAAPEKDDHTFEGWFFDNGTWQERLTANTYEETPLTEDVSVYAYYKKIGGSEPEQPQEYTVIFEVDHGTPIAPITTSRIDEEPQTTVTDTLLLGGIKTADSSKKRSSRTR